TMEGRTRLHPGRVPAGGILSGSPRQTQYEYTMTTTTMTASVPPTTYELHCARSKPLATQTSPEATKSQPPRRCVFVHDCLLESVHGVRMPMNQFGRILPRRLPSKMNIAPASTGSVAPNSSGLPCTESRTSAREPATNTQ